jgi:predicted phage terminase large subunit-like protein
MEDVVFSEDQDNQATATNFAQLAVQRARERLATFCMAYDRDYTVNWHHRKIAEALEKVERGEIKRLIIQVQPRAGKSQLSSIYFPAWYLGKNPEKEVIIVSYSSELAVDFGGKARAVVEDPHYKKIFPLQLAYGSKAKDKWSTQQGGSYTAVGIGGALTGRGADVLIIDDPFKNREEANSRVMRDKVYDFYTSTAYTRLEKGGSIVIIHTRWHTDDLIGRLLEKQKDGGGGDEWTILSFPAIAEEDEEFRKAGEVLWPEKYDLQAMNNVRETVGTYDWVSLFQQNPIASEAQEFREEFFKYFEEKDIQNKDLEVYVTVDPAISKASKGDNTCIMVVGKERGKPDLYKLEDITGHFDPGQTIDALFSLKVKYGGKLARIGIETVAFQKTLLFSMNEEMRKRGIFIDVIEIKNPGSSKEERVRGLLPIYRTGTMWHRKSDTELEKELLTFPSGRRDDRIDALSMMLSIIRGTVYNDRKPFIPNWLGYKKRA